MRQFLTLFLLYLLSSTVVRAQSRKYSNDFLTIGVGSRAFGMSGAVAASANDVTAAYWNPAGLSNMNSNVQVGLMHSEYFTGLAKYDYAGVAAKIDDKSTGAISVIRFGVDDIPNTTELIDAGGNINYDRITTFSAVDYAFIGSYSRKMTDRLSLGGNVKVIHRKIGSFGKSWGFGIDASALYRVNKFSFAAVAKDLTSTFNAWTYTLNQATKDAFVRSGNEIPSNSIELTNPRLILGTAYTTQINPRIGITTGLDADITTDGPRNVLLRGTNNPFSIDPRIGVELDYRKIVYVRGGVGNIQQVKDFDGSTSYMMQPNIGIGLKLSRISIDYAFTDVGNSSDVLYSNVFSLRLDISRPN